MEGFVATRDGRPIATKLMGGKHPKSLWRDETLFPRQLDHNENIFDVIMPWTKDLAEELAEKKKAAKDPSGKQTTLSGFFSKGKGAPAGKKQKPSAAAGAAAASEEDPHKLDPEVELDLLSKVVKVHEVEKFDWKYKDARMKNGRVVPDKFDTKHVTDVQCIFINPKWGTDHGFDPESVDLERAKADDVKPAKGKKQKKLNKKSVSLLDSQGSADGGPRGAFSGIKIEELKELYIPTEVMKEGIMFIWTEKELIGEIIEHFEKQGFDYVENMVYVMLNPAMKAEVERYRNIDATPGISREYYKFISKSHKTLLMLRRSQKDKRSTETKQVLELRHQRTGDVVFDWTDPSNPFKKPSFYTYKLIETLLPKAHNKLLAPDLKVSPEKFDDERRIKMIELWAPDSTPRRGWLKVCSLK